MRMADLKPGWKVLGNDGRHVGDVRDVSQNYVLTSGTRFGSGDIYIPASAIANVEHEVVYLSLPQDHRLRDGLGPAAARGGRAAHVSGGGSSPPRLTAPRRSRRRAPAIQLELSYSRRALLRRQRTGQRSRDPPDGFRVEFPRSCD